MNKNIPELRFPEFSGEWQLHRLGNFFVERNENSSEQIPLYSLTIENGIVPKSERYERSHLVNDIEDAYKIMVKDDFAFNPMNLRFGALARHKGNHKVAVSKYYNIFYCNENGDSSFFDFYLTSYNQIQYYNKMATGSLVEKKRVHYLDFINFKKRLPSLPEQQKIATFLSAIDDKLQALKKKKALLEQYKKGVMQAIFSQKVRFKDDYGEDYPEWEMKKLGEVGTFFSGGTPLTTKRQYFDGTIPFIRSGEIGSSMTLQYITEEGLKNSSAKMIEVGDLIYALYGATSGEVGISKIKGAINQAILCIRSQLNNIFLYNYLTLQKDNITSTYLQGGQGNLSADIIKSLEIPIPSLPEQTKIAKFLTAIDEKLTHCQAQIEQTDRYKKGLLQKMFC